MGLNAAQCGTLVQGPMYFQHQAAVPQICKPTPWLSVHTGKCCGLILVLWSVVKTFWWLFQFQAVPRFLLFFEPISVCWLLDIPNMKDLVCSWNERVQKSYFLTEILLASIEGSRSLPSGFVIKFSVLLCYKTETRWQWRGQTSLPYSFLFYRSPFPLYMAV